MGKKKLAIIGGEEEKQEKKIVKSGKSQGNITDFGDAALKELDEIKKRQESAKKQVKETEKVKKAKPKKQPGKRYLKAKKKVKQDKEYALIDAIKLAQETSISSFEGSIEAHLVVKEAGLKGEITFPHSTGKKVKAEIVSDKVLKKIENGKIDFNLLIATPADMPSLAKHAKVLGPKGLMPNPKTGTITNNPKEALKKLSKAKRFKTEPKAPLIHITLGKTKQSPDEIYQNFKALAKAVNPKNITKITITSTMGPGIKVDIETI